VMAAVEKLGRLLGDILVRRRSELALRAAHSELARVSQFSAMGAMTASIGTHRGSIATPALSLPKALTEGGLSLAGRR